MAKARKDGHVHARDEDDEPLLLDRFSKGTARGISASQSQALHNTASQAGPSKKADAEDSATEDEEEEGLLLDAKPSRSATTGNKHSKQPQLPSPSGSDSLADPGRAPGRIIGATYPLQDFKKNIAQGDLVTKAVEDLGAVIKEVVVKPFASRRHMEMVECMAAMRDTALQEDEIDAWNECVPHVTVRHDHRRADRLTALRESCGKHATETLEMPHSGEKCKRLVSEVDS